MLFATVTGTLTTLVSMPVPYLPSLGIPVGRPRPRFLDSTTMTDSSRPVNYELTVTDKS
ncbi:hypothetical protein [Calothrix sp. 336/3]|uniref:hypothetical protein n=1 Tax=Calothrix sp. 336/3 TaxID=1337936 RepID=UPI00143A43D9|nr:hypothetical protein [Calothrix sp. 336/3]